MSPLSGGVVSSAECSEDRNCRDVRRRYRGFRATGNARREGKEGTRRCRAGVGEHKRAALFTEVDIGVLIYPDTSRSCVSVIVHSI